LALATVTVLASLLGSELVPGELMRAMVLPELLAMVAPGQNSRGRKTATVRQ